MTESPPAEAQPGAKLTPKNSFRPKVMSIPFDPEVYAREKKLDCDWVVTSPLGVYCFSNFLKVRSGMLRSSCGAGQLL